VSIVHHIAIQFSFRVPIRIEGFRHIRGFADNYIGRQMGVDCPNENFQRMLGGGVEVDDLANGMDAGISPPTGVDADFRLTRQLGDGLLQRLLYGPVAGLRLPAVELSAVVAEGEFDVSHRSYQLSAISYQPGLG